MDIFLSQQNTFYNNVTYVITLWGSLISGEKWKFLITINYSMNGKEVSMELPYKLFNKLRLTRGLKKIDDVKHKILPDETIQFDYKSSQYIFHLDLLKVIEDEDLSQKFGKAIRKCNKSFNEVHQKNIQVWLDKAIIPSDLDTIPFAIKTLQTLSGEYKLHINARTSSDLERWYTKIELSHISESQSDLLEVDPLDFLALRDYCIQLRKQFNAIIFSAPSGKDVVVIINEDSVKIEIDDQSLVMNKEFINFIAEGDYFITLMKVFEELNHELVPQPVHRWWFNHGKFFIDTLDKFSINKTRTFTLYKDTATQRI